MGVESEENMTKWMNKLSVAACALLLAGSVACGNNEENNDSNNGPCADGEINVAGGSLAAGCYKDCTADAAACGATQECKTVSPSQKLCVEKKADMNNNNKDKCADGEVEASWKGETKCFKDCSADANACTGDNECKTAGSESICVPKEVGPACGADEVETVVGGGTAQCYKKCTGNPDCAADGKICKADDGGANMVCVEESQAAQLCREAYNLLLGDCAANNCGNLTAEQNMQRMQGLEVFINQRGPFQNSPMTACENRVTQDMNELAFLQQLVGSGCDGTYTKLQQCTFFSDEACGCKVPDYTKGCTMDSDCEATIAASCRVEDPNTMTPPGGQCSYGACQVSNPMNNTVYDGASAGCGPDTYCLVQEQNGGFASSCISPCSQNSDCPRAVTGDADSGYVCAASLNFGNGQYLGQCVGACATDADCNDPNNPNAIPQICGDNRTCEVACDAAAAGMVCSIPDPNNANMMITLAGTSCTATQKDAAKFGCKIAQPYTSPF